MESVAQGVPQPQRDEAKLKFLAEYAAKDCGCSTPEAVIALFSKLDTFDGYGAPHTLVDRLYASAQLARSVAAFRESRLA